MALRASYYGLKKKILDKVLGDYDAAGVMTNKELTENKLSKASTVLIATDDLDNVFENGLYAWANSPVHAPTTAWGKMIVQADETTPPTQFVYDINQIYIRRYGGSPATWSSWYRFVGTVIS